MKTSREILIKKLLCVNTNTHLLNREKKLYFLFLHEDFYGSIIENNDCFFVSKFSEKEEANSFFLKNNSKKYRKGSFLTVKYIINFLRSNHFSRKKESFLVKKKFQEKRIYKNFLSFSADLSLQKAYKISIKKEMGFYFILDSITFILLCYQGQNFFCTSLTTKNFSISLHKPLKFIENHWGFSSFKLEGCLFHFIHPEILIRILRQHFQDISFLHLFRNFLHFHLPENLIADLFSKKVRTILWNIYALEIDHFFVSNHAYSSMSNENDYKIVTSLSSKEKFNEWMLFGQKPQCEYLFQKNLNNRITEQKQIFLDQSKTYKYVRTNMNWLLFFQKENFWSGLIKKSAMHFFVYRLGYIFSTKQVFSFMKIEKMSDNFTSFFLGYVLQFSKKKNLVKINTKFVPLISPFVLRVLVFMNPFSVLSFLLSKQNFCNFLGYPKAKSGWVTLPDTEIIYYFLRIRNSLFVFYSGCHNTKSLSRIQYILNLSCAKTLACKHKTSLREISKKFAKDFIVKDFSNKSLHFFSPRYSRTSRLKDFYTIQKTTRFWNFQFIQIDSLFLHLEDLYNFFEM